MTPSAAFLRRVFDRRKAIGLSQEGLSAHMRALGFGWYQATVAKTERGRRPLLFDEAVALSDYLTVPLHEEPPPGLLGPELARLRAENARLRARISNAVTALTDHAEENR